MMVLDYCNHFVAIVVVVAVVIEVSFGIDFPVLGFKVFSDTSFLIPSIKVSSSIDHFTLVSIELFQDILSFDLLKQHIQDFFDTDFEQVLDFEVFFDILDLPISLSSTISFDIQVFFDIVDQPGYFVFPIFILYFEFDHLNHLDLAMRQQMALLIVLCFTYTILSYLKQLIDFTNHKQLIDFTNHQQVH